MLKDFLELDKKLSKYLFDLQSKSQLVRETIELITRGYGIALLIPISLLISKNLLLTLGFIGFILFVNYVFIEHGLKKLFKRERPEFLIKRMKSYSFPSTHATTMGMTLMHILSAASLYKLNSNLDLTLFLLAFIWGIFVVLSRVIYGYHHVSDIVFGILLGALIGFILNLPLYLLY